MAKTRSGLSKTAYAPATATAAQPLPDTQMAATVAAAQSANAQTFADTDNAPYHDLYAGRQYYQSQTFDIDTRMALQDYLHDQAVSGSLYAPSQILNYAMRNGQTLTANQQFMVDSMTAGMHNLGYNVNLYRYARVDFMQGLGAGNYENMSIAQLQKALVGKGFVDKAFVSTSYNDFKTAPPGNAFTDKAIKIIYKAPAKTQALMPGNGPGGALGEIVLAPGQHYVITDVKFPGGTGRSGGSTYKRVELTVEVR